MLGGGNRIPAVAFRLLGAQGVSQPFLAAAAAICPLPTSHCERGDPTLA